MAQLELIESEESLEDLLTRPSPALVESARTWRSPLLILGAGGKMGPTLAVLARRAAQAAGVALEIVAVSRFGGTAARQWLESRHVTTVPGDLLNPPDLARLPDTENLIYLAGGKFGTTQQPWESWAINTLAPATVAARYPHARMVALSTGNVYPFVPIDSAGSLESDALTPLGEYANSCLGRERMFEYFSRRHGTRIALIRLNYAVELRYGVLVDLARKVVQGEPIDLTMGWFNCLWQGDANDLILRALALADSPPCVLNLTGTEKLSVRQTALRFGECLNRPPRFENTEAETALLNNPSRIFRLLGPPSTPVEDVLRWTAHWFRLGGRLLNKPTHFQTRDGKF